MSDSNRSTIPVVPSPDSRTSFIEGSFLIRRVREDGSELFELTLYRTEEKIEEISSQDGAAYLTRGGSVCVPEFKAIINRGTLTDICLDIQSCLDRSDG